MKDPVINNDAFPSPPPEFARTGIILGDEACDKLSRSSVAVFGLGGVGSWTAEALARAGVGSLTLVDHDVIDISNINRQLLALHSTVGRYKAEVMAERLADINPRIEVDIRKVFYTPENSSEFDLSRFDFIADAIDTVSSKIDLIMRANDLGVPIISCMGTGNKLKPSMLRVADIYATDGCPLARVMRRELRHRGLKKLSVVYSPEPPIVPRDRVSPAEGEVRKKDVPGSISFVPPAAGMLMAAHIINSLIGEKDE